MLLLILPHWLHADGAWTRDLGRFHSAWKCAARSGGSSNLAGGSLTGFIRPNLIDFFNEL